MGRLTAREPRPAISLPVVPYLPLIGKEHLKRTRTSVESGKHRKCSFLLTRVFSRTTSISALWMNDTKTRRTTAGSRLRLSMKAERRSNSNPAVSCITRTQLHQAPYRAKCQIGHNGLEEMRHQKESPNLQKSPSHFGHQSYYQTEEPGCQTH